MIYGSLPPHMSNNGKRSSQDLKRALLAIAWNLLIAAGGLPGIAHADRVVVSYQAGLEGNPAEAPSPATLGWSPVNPTNDLENFENIGVSPDGDSGLNAWRTLDNSTAGGQFVHWTHPVAPADHASASEHGWTLAARVRIDDPHPDNASGRSVTFSYGNGSRRWLLFFNVNADEHLVVDLWGGSSPITTLTLTDLDVSEYHEHQLVWNPETNSTEYLVNGVVRHSGYNGVSNSFNGVRFGTESSGGRGDAHWNEVVLAVHEPASMAPRPVVVAHPESIIEPSGAAATLTAAFSGAVTDYQWFKNGEPIPGAEAATLTLDPLAASDEGEYWCRAYNGTDIWSETDTAAVMVLVPGAGLRVNEFLASNGGGLRDEDGSREDWIEIFNADTVPVSTEGWHLSDQSANPLRWALPNAILQPGEFRIVFASGKNRDSPEGEWHTNFSLSAANGEEVLLSRPDGTLATHFAFGPQTTDISMGYTPDGWKFFDPPSPDAPNLDGRSISGSPGILFDPPPGVHSGGVEVTITADGDIPAGAVLRYTTDDNQPDWSAPQVDGPIEITENTPLRVALIAPGERYGIAASAPYLISGINPGEFSSPLPLVILSNFGGGDVPGVNRRGPHGDGSSVIQVAPQSQMMAILEEDADEAVTLESPATSWTRTGLRRRGSSSFNFSRRSYRINIWGERGTERRNISLLDMPEENDWVLYAPDPSQFDITLIHNAFAYELARRSGFIAPRFRLVEVFLDINGDGLIDMNDHRGLYLLVETVKRDRARVPFSFMSDDGSQGGWMISVDRMDTLRPGMDPAIDIPRHFHTAGPDGILQTPDDSPRGFKGTGGGGGLDPIRDDQPNMYHSFFNFDSPDGWSILPAQRDVIQTAMRDFDAALYGADYQDKHLGWAPHIDALNWAHHMAIHQLTRNQDAVVLSAFLYQENPEAPIRWASVWDFDRAFHRMNSNPNSNLTWAQNRMFYERLFTDPEFAQVHVDTWQELRRGAFATPEMHALIDELAAAITPEVAARSGINAATWQTNLDNMKSWLATRAASIDALDTAPPEFSILGSNVLITATTPFHYTTTATDPRLRGGAISPSATAATLNGGLYQATVPIHLAKITWARALDGGNWSGLVSGEILQDLPDPTVIHQWDFENATTFLNPSATVGGSTGIDVQIDPAAEPAPEVFRNTAAQGFPTAHLRVNEPLDVTLTWHIPTTGFDGIFIDFLSRRSVQGAGEQHWHYTTDGETWIPKKTLVLEDADPAPYQLDFRSTIAANNNPDFALRVTFAQGEGGSSGNNRFDDFTVTAYPSTTPGNPPASITFDSNPTGTASGSTLAPVVVRLLDENGNPAVSFDGPVTLSLVGDGFLTGTTTVDAVFGTATFDDLVLTGTGTFQLTATAAGLDPATTATFQSLSLTTLILPQFIQGEQDAEGDNNDRVPFAWQARIDGLSPLATYRIGNRVAVPTEDPDNDGAGNAIYITGATTDWIRNTNAPRFRPTDLNTRHIEITADADGTYTGWFITEPTGNPRFAPGNHLHMRLLLNDGNGGEDTAHILTTTESAKVLRFGTATNEGTGIIGETSSAARRIVLLYDDTTGTSRPLAATPVEISGAEVDDRYVTFYQTVVATNPQHWGTIIPNDLPNGLRRIETRTLTGDTILDTRIDPDGIPGTANPNTGSTPILLDAATGIARFLPGGDGSWNNAVNWSTQSVPDGDGQNAILNAPIGGNRAVTLNAPVTLGDLRIEQNASPHRNRIDSDGEIETLTFANDSQPARLRVLGNGEGFVEFDLDAPVVLNDNLRLIIDHLGNEADDAFGGLRLRGEWQGPGGLIKQGVGIASLTGAGKDFTGPILIEQGALRVTGPATPENTSGVTVLEGSQLRLVSSGSIEEPRVHTFGGGAIQIGGMGRGGALPPGQELGVLGALRYDPSDNDNLATLTNALNFTADTDIHIDGTRNTLRLDGPLTANGHTLIKTGGGILHLAADSPSAPPVNVESGILAITANYPASIDLTADTTLTGNGNVTAITGPGTVDPGDQQLNATTSSAANYAFLFTENTTGTLALSEIAATPDQIDIHLDVESLTPGTTFQGGLLLPNSFTLPETTTLNLLFAEEDAPISYRDQTYRVATESDNLTWSIIETAEGHLIEVAVAPEVTDFALWQETHFTPAELADPSISGPNADPSGMGTPNLLRYALGLTPTENPTPRLPQLSADLAFRFPIDREKTDIEWRVLTSTDLVDWSEVVYDSTTDPPPSIEDGWATISLETPGSARRFARLEVRLSSEEE